MRKKQAEFCANFINKEENAMVLRNRKFIKKDAIICVVPCTSNKYIDRQRIT